MCHPTKPTDKSQSEPVMVIVWRCLECGSQREPGPMPPHISKHANDLPSWMFTGGGMTHRCSTAPQGEVKVTTRQRPDGVLVPCYGYEPCRMEVLQGEEAEEWETLRSITT